MRRTISRPLLIITISLLLLVTAVSVTHVMAQDRGEARDGEGGFAGALGGLAAWCLAIGGAYVAIRRLYMWSKTWGEQNPEEQEIIKSLYGRYRKPLLYVHNGANIAALIIGGIHGLLLLNRDGFRVVTGIVAWGIMAFLSFFGFFIFLKLRPIWDNREIRGFLRFVHRQWILTGILVIVLLIHVA